MPKILQTETVAIDSIRPDLSNARAHDERNISAIVASLRRFGQQKPIVVDHSGQIVAGSGTHAAAKALEWPTITIVRTDLSGANATAYAIADNRTSELATWDTATLAALLGSLRDEDATLLDAAGFTDGELDAILDDQNTGVPPGIDDAAMALGEAQTKPGDLIILGEHRLLCGDSSNSADLARLMNGKKIQLVNTDPPYNVAVEPRSNNAIRAGLSSFAGPLPSQRRDLKERPGRSKPTTKQMRPKDRPLANDFMSPEQFKAILLAWFGNVSKALEPGRAFYIWGGYSNITNYPPALAACKLHFAQTIIWVKQHPVMGRKDFMGNHEWCFYGWKEGAAHYFNPRLHNIPDVWKVIHASTKSPLEISDEPTAIEIEAIATATTDSAATFDIDIDGIGRITLERKRKRKAPDVWEVKKVPQTKMVHLTEKPVELAARAMKYSSRRGENVLDLFAGSGSTLMAAETMERRAFLMELDPHYCDVIVTRWENHTKRKAKRP